MPFKLDRSTLHWLGVICVTLVCLALQSEWAWMAKYPKHLVVPLSTWLNAIMDWTVEYFGWFFLGISWLLEWPIKAVRYVLNALPWSVTMFVFCVVAWAASGWKLAVFTFGSLLYMLVFGYWTESMNTLSLVAISVPFAIVVGFGFGIWGFFSTRAERVIMPMLDGLQTVPSFAYLLPILMLFGFGTVVGLIASVLYSFPPMVRNTIVGSEASIFGSSGSWNHVRCDTMATVLASPHTVLTATTSTWCQSDNHGLAEHGDYRLDYRRHGGYRLGSAVDYPQGAVR